MIPKISLGHINFVNCLPLTFAIETTNMRSEYNIESAVPAILNSKIINGELDITPVSSIIYALNNDKLKILPNVSISADGAVQSILLVSKKPITELDNKKINLTAKSATSHCLLKIVLKEAYSLNCNYEIINVDMNNIISNEAEATLLIGDDALFSYHNRQADLFYYDIGAEWKVLTGLPMVYAVWVVNNEAKLDKADLKFAHDKIVQGFKDGFNNKNLAIESVLNKVSFTSEQISGYLKVLNWDFTAKHKEALLKFYELAYNNGLIDKMPKIEFVEVE